MYRKLTISMVSLCLAASLCACGSVQQGTRPTPVISATDSTSGTASASSSDTVGTASATSSTTAETAAATSSTTASADVTGTETPATTESSATPGETIQESAIAVPSEAPLAPEVNPPGDIPDDQAFIQYSSSAGGYTLQVPEGWARSENGASVNFADKFDGVSVDVFDVSYTLTADNIVYNYEPALQSSERAVTISATDAAHFTGGDAVVISYTSNSEPDSVTNKQIRLENEAAVYINNGKMAVVKFWAPQGADNVDQWNFMKNSFGWQ